MVSRSIQGIFNGTISKDYLFLITGTLKFIFVLLGGVGKSMIIEVRTRLFKGPNYS